MIKEKYTKQNSELATCYNNLGAAYREIEDIEKAIKYFNKSAKIYTNIYGPLHDNTL